MGFTGRLPPFRFESFEPPRNRSQESRYSRRFGIDEIEQHEFNLNISRYISTAVGEDDIDLSATRVELSELDAAVALATIRHTTLLKSSASGHCARGFSDRE
jgi:type I restriction-modification system DNA methylase subunit